jgi:hypothetical protein
VGKTAVVKADQRQYRHSEETTAGEHAYSICVGGGLDGHNSRDPVGYGNYSQTWENNLWLRLENNGDEEVIDPWVRVGNRDWRSLDSIVAGIVDDDMDEAGKARAIWEFARRHRYHFTTGDDEVKDTVKMLNVYGYTLCWDEAYTLANLWRAAGLKTRRGFPHGHCTTEVFYEGAYHLLDSDEHLLVLQRDNRTVASETDIAHDHDLMKRSHAYGILAPEDRKSSEAAASLFVHDGPRAGDRADCSGHRMDLRLRPGEALVWAWENRGLSHGPQPPRLCNGRLEFTPRLDGTFAAWTERTENLEAGANGLQASDPQVHSLVQYRIASPYVMVGARLEATVEAQHLKVELSLDGQTWTPILSGEDLGKFEAGFGSCLPAAQAAYACHIRLRGHLHAICRLRLVFDLQMAPLSLPGLVLGENHVVYSDRSQQRRVRLTHAWRERDVPEPAAPGLLLPAADARPNTTQFTFSWEAVAGAVDYHFELSEYADFRHCLSPVFEKLSSRTPAHGRPHWRIPEEGLLNPDQPYYWRVRARADSGRWGPFSAPASFKISTPSPPLDLKLEIDREEGSAVLRWRAGAGAPPCRYEVYGSDERGFSARRRTHTVFGGSHGKDRVEAANLLASVDSDSCRVIGNDLGTNGNRAFYRVVAIGTDGSRSGPSTYLAAPRPFIYSHPPSTILAGRISTYQVMVIRSIGDLRSISSGPHRYASAFRDGDIWRFLLDEGPAWVSLDEHTGIMMAVPPADQKGLHTITLRICDAQGRADIQGFDLEVIEQEMIEQAVMKQKAIE